MQRREYLAAVSSAGALAAAGCLGGSDTDNPRRVVSAYIETEHEGDADALADLLHSESPIDPSGESGESDRSVDIRETILTERDLSGEQLRSLDLRLPAEAATAIGAGENALVDVEYEMDTPSVEDDGTGPTGDRVTVENTYLTARENGDWLVVTFSFR